MLSSKTLFSLMNIVSIAQANISYAPAEIQHGYIKDAKKDGAERGLRQWDEYERLLSELKYEYEKAVAFENANIASEAKDVINQNN